jgi:hypothetical protein
MHQQVLRLENDRGPFTRPYPYSITEFKKLAGYVSIVAGSIAQSGGPELAPTDDIHPTHFQDVLDRRSERALADPDLASVANALAAGDWRTGVKDEEQLLHWFPPKLLTMLVSVGFNVALYEVPAASLWSGDYQVMFDRDCASLRPYDYGHLIELRPTLPHRGGAFRSRRSARTWFGA